MFACPLYGSAPSMAPTLSTALCFIKSPLSTLQPSFHSTALCPFYFLSSLRPSFSSTAICFVYIYVLSTAFFPTLQYSVTSMAPCSLYASVPSTAFYSLYGPLFPLRPSILSMDLCFLNRPLPPLQPLSPLCPSVPFKALCPLYGPVFLLQLSVPSMAFYPSTALC
jgi:hypothetical protein